MGAPETRVPCSPPSLRYACRIKPLTLLYRYIDTACPIPGLAHCCARKPNRLFPPCSSASRPSSGVTYRARELDVGRPRRKEGEPPAQRWGRLGWWAGRARWCRAVQGPAQLGQAGPAGGGAGVGGGWHPAGKGAGPGRRPPGPRRPRTCPRPGRLRLTLAQGVQEGWWGRRWCRPQWGCPRFWPSRRPRPPARQRCRPRRDFHRQPPARQAAAGQNEKEAQEEVQAAAADASLSGTDASRANLQRTMV
jgi:hypothetical protein